MKQQTDYEKALAGDINAMHRLSDYQLAKGDLVGAEDWLLKIYDNDRTTGTTLLLSFYQEHCDDDKSLTWDYKSKYHDLIHGSPICINKYDNPAEAWEEMGGIWGDYWKGKEYLYVLDDSYMHSILLYRAIKKWRDKRLDGTSENHCRTDLLKTQYLLDFNFFYYSERTKKFYTSMMELKEGNRVFWNDDQWDIFDEIRDIQDFEAIASKAEKMESEMAKNMTDILNEEEFNDRILDDFGIAALPIGKNNKPTA